MDFNYDEWVQNIKRLQKNRENVPEDVLKTKYAKPYNDLLGQIRKQADAILREAILAGFPILKDWDDEDFPDDKKDVEELCLRINSTIDLARISGTMRRIRDAIFSEYDPEKALAIADGIRDTIEREAYLPYWQKHCSLQEHDTVIFNDLIGFKWVSENLWSSIGGKQYMIITWPPPKEMVEAVERRKNGDQDHRIQE